MWVAIFCALTAGLSFGCLIAAGVTVQSARAERESLHRRLRSCESSTQSNATSVEELAAMVTDLANRMKMQGLRKIVRHPAAGVASSGEPDPAREPELWRAWKNQQLRTGVVN